MMLDLSKLIDSRYYFESNPGGDFLFGYLLLLFFIGLFFIGPICEKRAAEDKYMRKSMKNQFWKFYFLGSFGLILVLARFASVPVFSMRIWLYLVLVASVVIMALTFRTIQKDYKKRLDSVKREKKKQKE